MSKLSFAGRVAIVTGAGTGLGREYAQLLASRGAQVVVNDLGSDRSGRGESKQADVVVESIKEKGGIAVPNYDSVLEGEKIVKTALDNFGRVDILVNNAGILRDRSFLSISREDWNLVHDVHLKGSFITTQSAWPIFRQQKFGRIVMTSSMSGICGNFGQTNYSAAKLGLIGLANTLALEGSKYNIHTNVFVPTATASRMTQDILPPDFLKELDPKLVAPIVAYLCHESNGDNGSIIESGAGWAAKHHFVRGKGAILRNSITEDVTLERVRDRWQKITDMSNAEHVQTLGDAFGNLIKILEQLKVNSKKGSTRNDEPVGVQLTDGPLQSDTIFAKMHQKIASNPNIAKEVNGIFIYNITIDGSIARIWTMDLKTAAVYQGEPKDGYKADAIFTMSDSFMVDLMAGNVDIPVAFLKGDMKITGNIMMTQKLVPFLKG